VCFSRLFAEEEDAGRALGINLVGAMNGGGIEYVSMVVGMRGVWIVALLLYGIAFATLVLGQRKPELGRLGP
jgi:hypothetical protein